MACGIMCPKASERKTPPEKALAMEMSCWFSRKRLIFMGTSQHTTLSPVKRSWRMILSRGKGMPNVVMSPPPCPCAWAPPEWPGCGEIQFQEP